MTLGKLLLTVFYGFSLFFDNAVTRDLRSASSVKYLGDLGSYFETLEKGQTYKKMLSFICYKYFS